MTILAGWPSGLRRWFQVPVTNILHCYKLTVLLAYNQFENNNIGRMAEWSKSHSCHATLLQIKSSHCQKNNSKIITNIPSTLLTILPELLSGLNHTPVMLHSLKLKVLTAREEFENIKKHSFNCIDDICRIAEWYQSHSCHPILLEIKSFNCLKIIRR